MGPFECQKRYTHNTEERKNFDEVCDVFKRNRYHIVNGRCRKYFVEFFDLTLDDVSQNIFFDI